MAGVSGCLSLSLRSNVRPMFPARSAIELRDDVTSQLFYFSLGLMTVPDVPYPQAADVHQTRNLVARRLIEVSQRRDKCHPQTLRKFEVVEANRITQAFDPTSE